MSDQVPKPPQWGPVTDPIPWDPVPWIWKRFRFPFPEGDPVPFPARVFEQIQIEDVFALRQASLETMREVFEAELNAQITLLKKQQEILSKYK